MNNELIKNLPPYLEQTYRSKTQTLSQILPVQSELEPPQSPQPAASS